MNIIITEEKDLNDFIINQCKKNIDEYTIDFDKVVYRFVKKIDLITRIIHHTEAFFLIKNDKHGH